MTLSLQSLSRRYGAVQALSEVSFDIRPGEVQALMGENGAGKSTLIRLLAGLERPDTGQVLRDGQPIALGSPADAEAAGLRFIHQELQVVPALSVAENMHLHHPYPTRAGLVRWGKLRDTAKRALARLGLRHIDPDAPMARLGASDRMLVRIAATLITDGPSPWLYVMDEPTAALTGAEAERLFDVIGELTASGAGVLYVSHRMAEVLRLARTVTVLRDGRHVSTRAIGDTTEGQIIADMTGRDLSGDVPDRTVPIGTAPLLQVAGLTTATLGPVSFDLRPGEILGVAGLAGSGRGALLRALIGASPGRDGTVTMGDTSLTRTTPPKAWSAGIAYVPRERRSEGLMMHRSILENVALPHLGPLARARVFLNRKAEARIVAKRGAEVRLKSAAPSQSCDHLSGGNQQKVLFARALAGSPKVLLLDEPTRGVDVGAKHDIYRLIRSLGDAGMGVILASSDLPELLGLSDRILVLHDGQQAHLVDNTGLTEADLLTLCYTKEAAA